jgi:hypothetical protein
LTLINTKRRFRLSISKIKMKINKKLLHFLKNRRYWMIVTSIVFIAIVGLLIILTNYPKTKTVALTTIKNTQSKPKTTTPYDSSKNTLSTTTPSPTTTTSTTAPSVAPLAYPAAPTNPIGTATSPMNISLSWTASDGRGTTIKDYYVLRDNSIIDELSGTSYSDNNLTPNTPYIYSIEAVGGDSRVSAKSTSILVQTPPIFAVTLGIGTVSPAPPTQSLLGDPIDFDFPITSNTSGTVTYKIVDSYGIVMQTPTTLTFNAAGTQNITLDYITPEDWPSINGNSLSATAQLEVLTPTTLDSNAVAFDWANF